jgi:hypothetical protein
MFFFSGLAILGHPPVSDRPICLSWSPPQAKWVCLKMLWQATQNGMRIKFSKLGNNDYIWVGDEVTYFQTNSIF